MDPTTLARNYDKIADHWNGPNFNRSNGLAQHRRALQLTRVGGNAIDIGCGSSGRIIDLLLEKGFEVEGLDYSVEMLKLAKCRHPEITFHHANICEWEIQDSYNFISAWDSIWHVPLDHQHLVLAKLCYALDKDGIIIFSSGAVDEPGSDSKLFLGQELYHAAMGVPAILKVLNDCNCVCRHLENDDWPNKHLTIIAQKK